MKKIVFRFSLMLIALLILYGCSAIIARLGGTIGGFYVDLGFDGFSGTGSGGTLILTFQNGANERLNFSLSPTNPSGTTPATKFAAGTYSIDGSTNQCDGSAMLGTSLQSYTCSGGIVNLSRLSFTAEGIVAAVAGTCNLNLEGSDVVDCNFSYGGQ